MLQRRVVSARRRIEMLGVSHRSRNHIYNTMPSMLFTPKEQSTLKPTMETQRQAAELFDSRIRKASVFKNSKVAEKQRAFAKLVHVAKVARHSDGCVRYSRKLPKIILQVIEAAVEADLFRECRSPKGSRKRSRLLPLATLIAQMEKDPWEFDPEASKQYVFLRSRSTKEDLPFDRTAPTPRLVQRRLERINDVNKRFVIEFKPWDEWEQDFADTRQLRPVHYAIFTDTFEKHGRIYTGRYGHQSLSKRDRCTIRFNGEASVELDYGGMHPRMLYHLEGIPYENDPYALWGEHPTPQQRLMAKCAVNAMLNAKKMTDAVSACNQSMKVKNKKGEWKCGEALAEAQRFKQAARETRLTFKKVCRRAMRVHERIAHHFCQDAGMRLMHLDSQIALDVLYYFAKRGIPCLGCHDSFIVPAHASGQLRSAMLRFYRRRLNFLPIVKPSKKVAS